MNEISVKTDSSVDIFNLESPSPVAKVNLIDLEKKLTDSDTNKSVGIVKIGDDMRNKLDVQASGFIQQLLAADPETDAFKKLSSSVLNLGSVEIKKSTAMSNRMLDRPMKSLVNAELDEQSEIGRGLLQLRVQIDKLDPSKADDIFSVNTLLSWLPFGNKAKNYFMQYQSAQSHINSIIQSLHNGKDELMKDNASIDEEKSQMWELMGKLEQYIFITKKLDNKIEEMLPNVEIEDEYKAKIIKQDVLFYIRQKRQDLLTHLAVVVQGFMALDIIKKNNVELTKGVDRASTTTISALRTAVFVSQALSGQKLVLDQIKTMNDVTERLINSNSSLLGKQALEINKQASESTIKVEVLQSAFTQIFQTLDAIDSYKVLSLDSMKKTIETLEGSITEANNHRDVTREQVVADFQTLIIEDVSKVDDGVVKII